MRTTNQETPYITMRLCPVCSKKRWQGYTCRSCGYEASRDYSTYMTLSDIPARTESLEAKQEKWLQGQMQKQQEQMQIQLQKQQEQMQLQMQKQQEQMQTQMQEQMQKQMQTQMDAMMAQMEASYDKKIQSAEQKYSNLQREHEILKKAQQESDNRQEELRRENDALKENRESRNQKIEKPGEKRESLNQKNERPEEKRENLNQKEPEKSEDNVRNQLLRQVSAAYDEKYAVKGYLTFGSYPQGANGEVEPIRWMILQKSGNRVLLLSEKILEVKAYHGERTLFALWEECDLRLWLTQDFLTKAFSEEEQKLITADQNTVPGDKIFLLSKDEVYRYLQTASEVVRTYRLTDHVRKQIGNSEKCQCNWWVRSYEPDGEMEYVRPNGSPSANKVLCDTLADCPFGVRPSMWIDLNASGVSEGRREMPTDEQKKQRPGHRKAKDNIRLQVRDQLYEDDASRMLREATKKKKEITFGSYPQSADGKREPIRWLVLEEKKDEVLLLSKNILNARQYHRSCPLIRSIEWDNCDLRQWLMNSFRQEAFSAEEQKILCQRKLANNVSKRTDGGKETLDSIFLLSRDEVIKYLPTGTERASLPTAYSQQQKELYISGGAAEWWLRSSGMGELRNCAMKIGYIGGGIHESGSMINGSVGVRPAIVLKLNG